MPGRTVSTNSDGLIMVRVYLLAVFNPEKSFLSPVIRYSELHAIADARTGISLSAMMPAKLLTVSL